MQTNKEVCIKQQQTNGKYSTSTLRRLVYKNSSAEFFLLGCVIVLSYMIISVIIVQAHFSYMYPEYLNATMPKGIVCTQLKAVFQ